MDTYLVATQIHLILFMYYLLAVLTTYITDKMIHSTASSEEMAGEHWEITPLMLALLLFQLAVQLSLHTGSGLDWTDATPYTL